MRHYKYRNQILTMDDALLGGIFERLEGMMRTQEVKYAEKPTITNEQLAAIKAAWPADLMTMVRERAAHLAAGTQVDGAIAYNAIRAVLLEELPKRWQASAASVSSTSYMARSILADLSLSMALQVPPSVSNERVRVINGKRYEIRPMVGTTRLVVNDSDVNNADIYVCALVNDQVSKAVLLGWTTSEQLRASQHGNKRTDPDNCSWSRMSFWTRVESLKPMIELMRASGVKSGSPGFAFESVPAAAELPIPDEKLDALAEPTSTKAKDNWYASIGLPDPISVARQEAPPLAPPKQDDDMSF